MPTVFADSRSIVHAGDGLQHVAAPPDVCKTPSPGGPVPIPYVNVAASSNLAKGTKKVKIEGKSAAISGANLSTSVGDEPGTAGGGLVSSKTKGKTTWATCSSTVKFEGKGAVRFLDVTQQNGNTFNTAFANLGQPYTAMAYGDDFVDDCEVCGNGPAEHRVHESESTMAIATDIRNALRNVANPTGSQRKALSRPFMIGVMVCKCDQVFISRSGFDNDSNQSPFNAFGTVAGGFGQFIRGPVTPGGLAAVNPAAPDLALAAIDAAWQASAQAQTQGVAGYLEPGTCAAQRLLQQSGHAPAELTEMFYTPAAWDTGGRPAEPMLIPYLRTDLSPDALARFIAEAPASPYRDAVLQNQQAVLTPDNPFLPGETVGSCSTCQDMLYMSNCPVRTCSGGGG